MASSGGLRRFLTPRFLIPGAIVAAVLAAVALIWFQPQKLFLDTRVDEAVPGAVEETNPSEKEIAKEDGTKTLSGNFRSLAHETTGRAVLEKASDGNYYIRFQDFTTENGPDLFVYLSGVPAESKESAFPGEFVDLGKLKGNIGNQNYLVPEGTDFSKYQSVIIWCRRFNAVFGAAPLSA